MNRELLKKYIIERLIKKFGNEYINIKPRRIVGFLTTFKLEDKRIIDLCRDYFNNELNPLESIYWVIKDLREKDKCIICNNKYTKFQSFEIGYRKYCSTKCSSNDPNVKEKIILSYKKHCNDKYGVDNVFQLESIKEKIKQTNLKKYGFENPGQSEEIKKKITKTNLFRYGVEHPIKLDSIKNKVKQTCLERYGEEHYFKTYEGKIKLKEGLKKVDFKKRYEKTKKTCLKKYGVENVSQNNEIKLKILEENKKVFFKKLTNGIRTNNLVTPLFTIDEFSGVVDAKKYEWKCNKCSNIFYFDLDDGRLPRCYKCFPRKKAVLENEIFDFISTFNIPIKRSDREILNGKEIDIFVPSKNLGIEFNGIYWHTENYGKDKNYHLNKTLQCKEKGVDLLHIFEDEWLYKKDIVKSIIKNKLGIIDNKIFARKTIIRELSIDESKDFFEKNHIAGYEKSSIKLGLEYNGEIVSAMLIGKSRFDKKIKYEIIRFCSKLGTIVIGGLSKLFKYFFKNYLKENEGIITYADLRYGEGLSYKNCGFKFSHKSKPSYSYIELSKMERLNRMKFQKHLLSSKLEIFDKELTESENMQLNGYDRIWDCGCNVYKYEKI